MGLLDTFLDILRKDQAMASQWPKQRDCDAFYGNPRGARDVTKPSASWEAANIVALKTPFRMTYDGQPVSSIRIHRKCAASLERILYKIWDASGRNIGRMDEWGASVYGGAYNYRLMRGSSSLSMHSWGCAIDLDPARNAFHDITPRLSLFPQVVDAFESEGWTWGGRWKGTSCDGMHFQAATV